MTNRMTGISGLIDTEALVTASMKPYKLKVDTQKQKMQTMQWQQEQYRKVLKDSKGFYDKYLDPNGEKSLTRPSKYTTTKFTSDKESVVTATGSDGAGVDNYSVSVTQLASKASSTLKTTDLSASDTLTFSLTTGADTATPTKKTINPITTTGKTNSQIAAELNTEFAKQGIKATAKVSEFAQGIVLESGESGADIKIDTALEKTGTSFFSDSKTGSYLNATITNSKNETYTINDSNKIKINSATVDNVTFNFTGTNAKATDSAATKLAQATTLTGKADITTFKENIKSFVEDYNTLLSSINTKIYETRDKSYAPLTDDEKKDMTETQIEKWEKKAQTGLLRKDDYLEEITRNMKDAMSSIMDGTGLSLESIGIEPVKYEYTDKNGLLKINDEKLTKALETNFEGVKDLLIKGVTTNDAKNGGVFTKLKVAMYEDTISPSQSLLLKHVGTDTSYNSLTNEMSKNLTDMKKRVQEMEKGLQTREDGLYRKYASLESALSSMQAQQNSLSSYFN